MTRHNPPDAPGLGAPANGDLPRITGICPGVDGYPCGHNLYGSTVCEPCRFLERTLASEEEREEREELEERGRR